MATFTAALPLADFSSVLQAFDNGTIADRVETIGEERDPAYCLRTRFRLDLADEALACFVSWLSGHAYVVERGRP